MLQLLFLYLLTLLISTKNLDNLNLSNLSLFIHLDIRLSSLFSDKPNHPFINLFITTYSYLLLPSSDNPFWSPTGNLPVFRHADAVLTDFQAVARHLKSCNYSADYNLTGKQVRVQYWRFKKKPHGIIYLILIPFAFYFLNFISGFILWILEINLFHITIMLSKFSSDITPLVSSCLKLEHL